jgi:hypothetical protein
MWNGAGYTLEEHLAWFESCTPVSVVGKERMHLFVRYTTADLRMRLEDVPDVFGISLWLEFVSYLRDNYVDRAAKVTLSAREFEDGVRALSPESVMSFETAVAFSEGFGQLAMRHCRGGGSEKLAEEAVRNWRMSFFIAICLAHIGRPCGRRVLQPGCMSTVHGPGRRFLSGRGL